MPPSPSSHLFIFTSSSHSILFVFLPSPTSLRLLPSVSLSASSSPFLLFPLLLDPSLSTSVKSVSALRFFSTWFCASSLNKIEKIDGHPIPEYILVLCRSVAPLSLNKTHSFIRDYFLFTIPLYYSKKQNHISGFVCLFLCDSGGTFEEPRPCSGMTW